MTVDELAEFLRHPLPRVCLDGLYVNQDDVIGYWASLYTESVYNSDHRRRDVEIGQPSSEVTDEDIRF